MYSLTIILLNAEGLYRGCIINGIYSHDRVVQELQTVEAPNILVNLTSGSSASYSTKNRFDDIYRIFISKF